MMMFKCFRITQKVLSKKIEHKLNNKRCLCQQGCLRWRHETTDQLLLFSNFIQRYCQQIFAAYHWVKPLQDSCFYLPI